MTYTTTQLFNTLRKKLGEDEAETLVTFITEDIQDEFEQRKEIFATRQALSETELRIIQRLDSHFKWLVGILFILIGLAVTIIKL
jgi:hypothetical protein